MPEPVRGDQRYLPGLDGVRALAVAAVVAYHLQLGWAQGGLLGVGVFFTLSGYLITDILLGQWVSAGRLRLGDFWLRRARRLLPALFVMLAAVAVWVTAFARAQLPGFRGDVVASALYVSNWWYIAQHASYYARFAPPGPLDHLWSLAVEEQFYLVWPWLVLCGMWLLSRRRAGGGGRGRPAGGDRWLLAAAALALAAASAVLMAVLYQPGLDPTRVYEGTDTRACELLIGAALAAVWPTRRSTPLPAWTRRLLDPAGVAGLAVVGLLVWRTNEYSAFMFRGGLVLLSLATALVLAAVAVPDSLLGRALGWQPLRWLGVRSYGIYLWHYPVIVLAAPAAAAGLSGLSAPRAVACVAASVALAAASWKFVEDPARRGLRRPPRPASATRSVPRPAALLAAAWLAASLAVRPAAWLAAWGAVRSRAAAAPLAAGALCLVVGAGVLAGVSVASVRLASAVSRPAATANRAARAGSTASADATAGAPARPAGTSAGVAATAGGTAAAGLSANATVSALARAGANAAVGAPAGGNQRRTDEAGALRSPLPGLPSAPDPAPARTPGSPVPAPPAPRTSCRSVVHIGDSTSEGLISPDYLPNPAQRITARYAQVGVTHSIMEITGGTSIVETIGGPNAYQVAKGLIDSGYHGCWVLALGTNDTADVYVGSGVGRVQRIKEMMSLIGDQPVLWIEVKSLVASGPYAEQNMQLWNQALAEELPHYPNMRLYDWPAVVRDSWFISDGIHYTSYGYAQRARLIADALAAAFPA